MRSGLVSQGNFSGVIPDIAGADGCLGFVIGAVLFVLALVVTGVLVSIGLEVGVFLGVLIAIPLYGLFRLSARLVVVNAKRCRGRLLVSLGTGLGYASAYATVIGVVFYGVMLYS